MSDWAGTGGWPRVLAMGLLAFLVYPAIQVGNGGLDAAQAAPAAAASVVLAGYVWACWRRPSPGLVLWPVLTGMAALGIVVPAVWGPAWLGLLLYPAVGAALLLPVPAGVAAATCLGAATAVIGLAVGAPGDAVLSIGLITVMAGLAASGVTRLTRLTSQLRAANADVARLAAAEERLRLARDLHDAVKQQLFVASLELGTCRASLGAAESALHLQRAEEAVVAARAGLAGLISGLRPVESGASDLAGALLKLAEDWQRTNRIPVRLHRGADGSCPPEVQQAMVWGAGEALTNVARHARAAAVSLSVESGAKEVKVVIADDGIGLARGANPSGHGIQIITERLALVGGKARVTGSPGGGTVVTLSWPRTSSGDGGP